MNKTVLFESMKSMNRNDLFKKLYQRCSGYLELRAFPLKERTFISLGDDWLTIKKQVDKFCEDYKDQNIYFGVATRDGRGGKKKNIISIPCVWIEIDYKDIPEEKVQEIIDAFSFKPTIIIKSGGGIHLYFLLERPVDLKRSTDVRNVNDWIRLGLGKGKLDNVGDITRILRLPDTVNHKYDDKPLCEVVEINENTYKLDDFLREIPESNTELIAHVEYVTKQIEEKKIVLGDDSYNDWLRIGFALADGLGERGREYFHRVSYFSNKYDKGDCDKQYDNCLNGSPPEERITIKTFFRYAKVVDMATNNSGTIEDITASSLMKMEFPEPKWMIPSIIPEGLSILCGKPKIGKSILSLNLAVAVATGGMALGKIQVEKSGVYYLALEDSHRRLKERFKAVLQNGKSPENLIVNTSISSIQDGGIEQLDIWLNQHKDVGFVIIDTYARIKGKKSNNTDIYLEDYNELVKIKEVADSHNIGLLLIHHTRKEESEDIFDKVLGSTGITAAADTLIVLEKNKNVVNLHVRGRDVEEAELALEFDSKTLSWMLVGDAREYSLTGERKVIVDLLRDKGCSMKLKDIADAIGKKSDNVRHLLEKSMEVMDGVIFQPKRGEYAIKTS